MVSYLPISEGPNSIVIMLLSIAITTTIGCHHWHWVGMRRVLIGQGTSIKPTVHALPSSLSWRWACRALIPPSCTYHHSDNNNNGNGSIMSRLAIRSITSISSPLVSRAPYHHHHRLVSRDQSSSNHWCNIGQCWSSGNHHRNVVTKANAGASRTGYSLANQPLPLSTNDMNNASSSPLSQNHAPSPSPSSPNSNSNNEWHPWAYVAYQSGVVFCSVKLFDYIVGHTMVPLLVAAVLY